MLASINFTWDNLDFLAISSTYSLLIIFGVADYRDELSVGCIETAAQINHTQTGMGKPLSKNCILTDKILQICKFFMKILRFTWKSPDFSDSLQQ